MNLVVIIAWQKPVPGIILVVLHINNGTPYEDFDSTNFLLCWRIVLLHEQQVYIEGKDSNPICKQCIIRIRI